VSCEARPYRDRFVEANAGNTASSRSHFFRNQPEPFTSSGDSRTGMPSRLMVPSRAWGMVNDRRVVPKRDGSIDGAGVATAPATPRHSPPIHT
jgi:hypothetical protein